MKFLVVLLFAVATAFSQVVVSVDESVSKNSEKMVLGHGRLCPVAGYG
jgi:hypothetical protein